MPPFIGLLIVIVKKKFSLGLGCRARHESRCLFNLIDSAYERGLEIVAFLKALGVLVKRVRDPLRTVAQLGKAKRAKPLPAYYAKA